MKRILKIAGTGIILLFLALLATWLYFDEENLELDDESRAGMEERFIELADGTVHFELGGPENGEVVVLVHGFSVPSYIWDPTFDFLTGAGYRVLRFDLYGRGLSDRPEADYTIGFFAEQLDQLVQQLGIETPFRLVGLSMGGPVTTKFTNRHPEKVRQLVLVDPLVFPPGEEDIKPLNWPLAGEYLAAVYLLPRVAAGQSSDFHDSSRFDGWESRFREQMRYRGFRRAILSTIREFPSADVLEQYSQLGESDTPVDVFWGREDTTVPFEHSVKLMERLPRARLTVIDQAGHLPHYERPEIFNPLLLELFRN